MIDKKRRLGSKVTYILVPFIYIAVLVVVGFISFNTGYKSIKDQMASVKKVQAQVRTLQEKADVLSESSIIIKEYADGLSNVLPNKNPSLTLISLIKENANNDQNVLTDFKVNPGTSDGEVTAVAFSYVVSLSSLVNTMIDEQKTQVPYVTYKQFKVNESGDDFEVDVSGNVYWSPNPDKIPPVSDKITLITDEEKRLLSEFMALEAPSIENIAPQGPYDRENPFAI